MERQQRTQDGSESWIPKFEAAALARAAEELANGWDGFDDLPRDDFLDDPRGTYIYDLEANEVKWKPSADPWSEHAIDVMKFSMRCGSHTYYDDGSPCTFESEVEIMRNHLHVSEIIDIDFIKDQIREGAEFDPHLIKPLVNTSHEMAAFCDIAQEQEPPLDLELMSAWAMKRWSGQGHTPLMAAARFGDCGLAERLFAFCDPLARNKDGHTAADLAREAGYTFSRHEPRAKLFSDFEQATAAKQAIASAAREAVPNPEKTSGRARSL